MRADVKGTHQADLAAVRGAMELPHTLEWKWQIMSDQSHEPKQGENTVLETVSSGYC